LETICRSTTDDDVIFTCVRCLDAQLVFATQAWLPGIVRSLTDIETLKKLQMCIFEKHMDLPLSGAL
jgi:hypothetical protein